MASQTKRHFNLFEENWIPVANTGLVSLRQAFTSRALRSLGGNPVQKIAVLKLLLSIAHAAHTPANDNDWKKDGVDGMASRTLEYLESKRELFWLFGDKPFLQMPIIEKAKKLNYGATQPSIASGNTTVLWQSQVEHSLSDAEKALLLVVLMGFATGGKKTDNSVVLTPGYDGKSKTGKPGSSLGYLGYLHSFILGESIQETVWLNLLSRESVASMKIFTGGIGVAPWESMPAGEDDEIARSLKSSLMGRLVPLGRFILLADEYLHYSEGIAHPGHDRGAFDPSISIDFNSKKPKALWADPEKRPWRQITALLAFLSSKDIGFSCWQLRLCMRRAIDTTKRVGIWSAGLRVNNKSFGEQLISGKDDFIESQIYLDSEWLQGDRWFLSLQAEMAWVEELAKTIFAATRGYYTALKADGKLHAGSASNLFWQRCERYFNDLCIACNDATGRQLEILRPKLAAIVSEIYDAFCPNDTARQLEAWAQCRPFSSKLIPNHQHINEESNGTSRS